MSGNYPEGSMKGSGIYSGVTVGENDGYCCPSKPMTKKFEISENGFREITEKQ